MAQYINKDALVAEIERRIELFTSEKNQEGASQIDKLSLGGRIAGLQELKVFIDTLEVKEVDLEKEYKEFVEKDPVYNRLVNGIVGRAIAKHFFELGLKVQKGE